METFRIISSVFLVAVFAEALAEENCKLTSSSMSCSGQSGKFLNVDTSADITSLYIINCNLSAISKDDFTQFIHLELVSISKSSFLFPVHDGLLSKISDLRVLRIENANVTEEVGSVFSDNHNILNLFLSRNKISSIRRNFISHLTHVEDIDLSQNEIAHIDVGAFDGLHSLKILNLSYNRIGNHFDPNFLVFAPSKCAVCKETTALQNCTNQEWEICHQNEPYDQLWAIPSTVTIELQDNPICDKIIGKNTKKDTNVIESPSTKDSKHRRVCKIYEKGHCFKHESRRMFLLEACGFKSIPSNSPDSGNGNGQRGAIPLVVIAIFIFVAIGAVSVALWRRKSKSQTGEYSPVQKDSPIRLSVTQDLRLHEAVSAGDVGKVQALLKAGVDPNSVDANGDLPLHRAARLGKLDIIKALLKKGIEINAVSTHEHAAIHAATIRGHHKVVEYLLDQGADPNVTNKYGNSPLSQACKEGHTEIVRLLLDRGANIHHRNSFEEVPIHHAARYNRLEAFKLLKEKGADIATTDKRGYTPLHYAAKVGNIEIARLILDSGESVDVRNFSQNTPLHKAAKNGHLEMIKFLVERNADVTATNFKGHKPSEVAVDNKCNKFLEQCEDATNHGTCELLDIQE